jgi:hypothetical protein
MARIFYAVCAALFLVAALLQYNDPDPWLWAPLYGVAAYCCYRFVRGLSFSPRLLLRLALGYSLGALAWMTYYWSAIAAGEREPIYESSGLGLVALSLGGLAWILERRLKRPNPWAAANGNRR